MGPSLPRRISAAFQLPRWGERVRVDAVIVQDLGVLRLVRAIAPTLHVHASTQMTCTDAGSVRFVADLGASRVILARELSVTDIASIRADAPEIELLRRDGLRVLRELAWLPASVGSPDVRRVQGESRRLPGAPATARCWNATTHGNARGEIARTA
ncbi:MAG: U32 family peptidase [Myxococcales bacterium]|nr:U32 family peptidase [Myxococcales bacterium]